LARGVQNLNIMGWCWWWRRWWWWWWRWRGDVGSDMRDRDRW